MFASIARILPATLFALSLALPPPASADDSVIRVRSAYPLDDTVVRLKKDIESKGITFFNVYDQTRLAAGAGIRLRPSALLEFGNPALGSQFIASKPESGLDWPVRLLVTQDDDGAVWVVYTDFAYIARRHGITDREEQFRKASGVIASIASSVTAR